MTAYLTLLISKTVKPREIKTAPAEGDSQFRRTQERQGASPHGPLTPVAAASSLGDPRPGPQVLAATSSARRPGATARI